MSITSQELTAGLKQVTAIAEAIRELKEVPSGHLYAQVMGHLSIESYNRIIGILTNAKLISVAPSHLIKWTGPKIS